MWPFNKLEKRQDSYADTLIAAIVSRAQGKTLAIPAAVGALEACAGTVGRAFMSCEVTGRPAAVGALTPSVLEMMGRSLIRRGESVWMIETQGGMLRFLPAETWDVTGGPLPETWDYRLTLAGPNRTHTYDSIPSTSVLHFRYAVDPARPWRGNSPLDVAALAGRLSANTINQLADEASGPVGRLLGIPTDGDDESVSNLKTDIRDARGRVALLETGDWDNSGSAAVDLETKRFGAEPPAPMIDLLDASSREVIAACGFNPSLFQVGPAAALRESWRLALFGVIAPLGRTVQAELADKIEDETLTLSWQELRASDLAGRARAWQSLVSNGMPMEQATAIAGLMVE